MSSSSTKANPPREVRRVPMACTNCRQKKLKCREPDEIQKECPRCIESGVPCEYVPVNPSSTTSNTPHHAPPPFLQPFHQGPQSVSPTGSIHPGYYPTQSNNIPWNQNLDPSLMGPQRIVPNPPTGGYPLGQPSLYFAGPPVNTCGPAQNPIFPPQSHGHQGPYLPSPGLRWVDPSPHYGGHQATSAMGRAPYSTQYGQSVTQTGGIWPNPSTNYYPNPVYPGPSGDQQDYPYGQEQGNSSER